jgi:hypothetical protein
MARNIEITLIKKDIGQAKRRLKKADEYLEANPLESHETKESIEEEIHDLETKLALIEAKEKPGNL